MSTDPLVDREGDAWDALGEDSDVNCVCDGCNYYSPTYDESRPCSLTTHVKAIGAARIRDLLADEGTVEKVADAITDAHWCESNYTKGCNCGDYRRREARAALGVIAGLIGGEQ